MWTEYTWIVVAGCLAAFFTAYGIGANDVANAFGSSVAARTLSMRQALLIASFCEFGGSVLLGGEVTRTVASGIAKLTAFDREPEMYMYGMLCALVASGTWLIVATYLGLPVSTTHSIAGAVLGFAFVHGGPRAVVWLEPQDAFPYMRGMVPIVVSWFISPLISGLATAALFMMVRSTILRREQSLQLAFWALPLLVMITVFINVFFVLSKGADRRLDWSSNKCTWVAAVIGAGCSLLTALVGMPLIRQYVYTDIEKRRRQQVAEMQSQMKSSMSYGGAGTGNNAHISRNASSKTGPMGRGNSVGAGGGGGGGVNGGGGGGDMWMARGTLTGTGSGRVVPTGSNATRGGEAVGAVGGGAGDRATDQVPGFTSPFVDYQTRRSDRQRPPQPSPAPPPAPYQQHQQHHQQHQQQLVGARNSVALTDTTTRSAGPSAQGGSFTMTQSAVATVAGPYGVSDPSVRAAAAASSGGSTPPMPLAEAAALITPALAAAASRKTTEQRQDSEVRPGPQQQQQQPQQANANTAAGDSTAVDDSVVEHSVPAMAMTTQLQQQQPQQGTLGRPLAVQQNAVQQFKGGVEMTWMPATVLHSSPPQQQQHYANWQQGYPQVGLSNYQQQHYQQQQLEYWQTQPQYQQMAHNGQQYGYGNFQQEPHLTYGNAASVPAYHNQWQNYNNQGPGQQVSYGVDSLQPQQQQQPRLLKMPPTESAQPQQYPNRHQGQGQQEPQHHNHYFDQKTAGSNDQQNYQQQGYQQQNCYQQEAHQQDFGKGVHQSLGQQQGHQYPQEQQQQLQQQQQQQPQQGHQQQPQLRPQGPVAEATEWGRGRSASEGAHDLPEEEEEDEEVGEHAVEYPHPPPADSGRDGSGPHWQNTFDQLKAIVLRGTTVNVHDALTEDVWAQAIHSHAEVFDPATEEAFKYLQVATAICDSFSHGANDVANSVGPFTAIWYIYRHRRTDYEADLPIWILVLGGVGIVFGLATYGYNIIRAIGVRLSVVTPSRGFAIELSTALVVAVASTYGLPVSTTHCQVGATAGMGLMEGTAGLHWRLAGQFFAGWVVTLLLTALLSAGMFAAGAYSPSVQQGRMVRQYEDALLELSASINLLLNRTQGASRVDPSMWGNFSPALNATLNAAAARIQLAQATGQPSKTRPMQHLSAPQVLGYLNESLAMYSNNSLPYIGGMAAKGQALPRRP